MSCRSEEGIAGIKHPILLPRPRRVKMHGGFATVALDSPRVSGYHSPDLQLVLPGATPTPVGSEKIACRLVSAETSPESYTLRIGKDSPVLVESQSEAGLRNGLRTLAQLIAQYGNGLPVLEIEDSPSFPVRGVMLDISRDRVPTMEHLRKTVSLLASWKINHFQLYTEHTFAYRGHEEVWKDASPFTPDEIRELDTFCRDHGVTLAANQNCFGHLTRWLQHPKYAHLAETQGEWNFLNQRRAGPFSLCPLDPGSLALVEDLLGQLLPNFSSGIVNIGCDETFDVGQGRSRAEVERRGGAAVYLDFVNRVADAVGRQNFRAQFWADIILNHPEAIERLPKELVALVWGYEPDSPFEIWCDSLKRAGREFWVCPGTSSWRSITGRTTERRGNLKAAAKTGVKFGAAGFMVTDWGDLGHRQQWPITLLGLAEAAEAAWNVDHAGAFDHRCADLFAFNCSKDSIGEWLERLGDVDLELRRIGGAPDQNGNPRALKNASALFTDLHKPWQDAWLHDRLSLWQKVRNCLKELEGQLPNCRDSLIGEELRHTLDVAGFAANRAVIRRNHPHPPPQEIEKLNDDLNRLIEDHRRLWMERSREGGLTDSCRYYEEIGNELRTLT